jgi:colanic acid biosynthesis glycosyl transferase WcaI
MPVTRKKLLLYSINFSPELTGIGKYNGELVRWLTRHGYEVRVVTAPPYYPQWRIGEGYSGRAYRTETVHGARVWRCPVWVPRRANGLRRVLHLASFALSSVPVMMMQMAWKPDLILTVEPPLFLSPLTVLLAKLFRIKSWLHVQDFEADAAFELGLLPDRQWVKSLVSWGERRLMQAFDAVSSISRPMTDRLYLKGIHKSKVRFFPNWADVRGIYPLREKPLELRRRLGLTNGQFVALYSGNLGEKQGLEIVLEAASGLRKQAHIHFIVCGEGVAKARLMAEARRRGLTNVSFLPLQPAEKLNELLNTADAHLLIQKHSATDLVMPSKLTGMLASGRPVVATAVKGTAVHAAVTDAEAGLVVPPEDAKQLAAALLWLSLNENSCVRFGRNARRFAVANLGRESIMSDFDESFHEIVTGLGGPVRVKREVAPNEKQGPVGLV